MFIGACSLCLGFLSLFATFQSRRERYKKEGVYWSIKLLQYYSFVTTLFYSLRLVMRATYGQCEGSITWYCNPYGDMNDLPKDTFLAVIMIPILFAMILKTNNWPTLVSEWFISSSALIFAVYSARAWAIAPVTAVMIVISILMTIGNRRQNLSIFTLTRDLESKTIEKSLEMDIKMNSMDKIAAEKSATEMRHMIGNVAHDLKTVFIILLL
jgi:hypothetical protein